MKKLAAILFAALAIASCGDRGDDAATVNTADAATPTTTGQSRTPAFAAPENEASVSNWVELGERAGMYSFETSDSPADVGAHYAELGEAAGLSPRETGGAPGVVYSASGPAGEITVAAPEAGGRTTVAVTWTLPAS